MPPGSQRRVTAGGRSIALFNTGGEFFALRDVCPHQGAPLSAGTVVGQMRADGPGEYRFDSKCGQVRCPWHGWEYDLATGQSWYDPENDRVKSYPVSVCNGAELQASEAPGERHPGPYVAETFDVFVEDDYIIIEV
jgi:nitrite reductase/ring-hydroxylating ferredoxin subunit